MADALGDLTIWLSLKDARIGFLNRMGAVSATGLILVFAEFSEETHLTEPFKALRTLLSPTKRSTEHYFAGQLLINMVAEFEVYLIDILKIVLSRHPKKLTTSQFRLSEIIGRSEDEVVLIAVERHLNQLMYKKPIEYLRECCDLLSIDAGSVEPRWLSFVEAKARRDLGIHNRWLVNETYLRKMSEAGVHNSASMGEDVCPNHQYVQGTHEALCELAETIGDLVESKYQRNATERV